jgi:hypothetical protein
MSRHFLGGRGLLGLAPCACVMISMADLIMEIHSITFDVSENL